MPASEHWITSRLAVLNPLSKFKNNEDEREEEIAATSVVEATVVAKGVLGRVN